MGATEDSMLWIEICEFCKLPRENKDLWCTHCDTNAPTTKIQVPIIKSVQNENLNIIKFCTACEFATYFPNEACPKCSNEKFHFKAVGDSVVTILNYPKPGFCRNCGTEWQKSSAEDGWFDMSHNLIHCPYCWHPLNV